MCAGHEGAGIVLTVCCWRWVHWGVLSPELVCAGHEGWFQNISLQWMGDAPPGVGHRQSMSSALPILRWQHETVPGGKVI
eukprot:scaffold15292_cov18-Tisochrysis_lutea.AAC.1